MLAWFTLTIFLSSALLFCVQPLFAKMLLPLLGGSPAVWNTCLVFFQTALLGGYAYAHFLPAWLGVRRHALLHLVVLFLPVLVLPLAIDRTLVPPVEAFPIGWLLWLLVVTVGAPFFAVASQGALLQKWFAETGHPTASDPYHLYVASNLGSMLALLSYPFLVEPALTLAEQSRLWTIGYHLLVVATAGCAGLLWRSQRRTEAKTEPPEADDQRPTWPRRLRWLALAFVPVSLLVSVTTYLTTDIAAVPFLWILPLAVYLLTFILAFARKPLIPPRVVIYLELRLILVLVLLLLAEATQLAFIPTILLLGLHVATLFVVGLVCHGELARTRPPVRYLTEFYLWLSAGGALGGLFNSLLAPVLFSAVVEYPLTLVLACLLAPARVEQPRPRLVDFLAPAGLGLLTAGAVLIGRASGFAAGPAGLVLMFAVPLMVCFAFSARPLRFGLSLGAVLLAGSLYPGMHGTVVYRERSFFGVHRVTREPKGRFLELTHGDTVHGRQSLRPEERREPLTYYHRTGPAGQVFAAYPDRKRVGMVGLGAGSLAAYGRQGQVFTFFEIDPVVIRIAEGIFDYLRDTPATVDIIPGDARLTLRQAEPRQFDLLVIDAFSSDSVPLHLITREALQLYVSKVADHGLILFHISNRYLDLRPVLAELARSEQLEHWVREDEVVPPDLLAAGKLASRWVVMARRPEDLAEITRLPGWHVLQNATPLRVWTDDYSNPFSVFQWRE
jgi:hypothetical protein